MRRSAAAAAMLGRVMKLCWGLPIPSDTARIEDVPERGEPLVLPYLCGRSAGDISETQDNSGFSHSALTEAMCEVSGFQPHHWGPLSALSTIEQAKDLCDTVSYHAAENGLLGPVCSAKEGGTVNERTRPWTGRRMRKAR